MTITINGLKITPRLAGCGSCGKGLGDEGHEMGLASEYGAATETAHEMGLPGEYETPPAPLPPVFQPPPSPFMAKVKKYWPVGAVAAVLFWATRR